MLKEEIINVRNKLNKMIENGENEEQIYQVSKELDELIVRYYTEGTKNQNH